jgi:hypothetical protein
MKHYTKMQIAKKCQYNILIPLSIFEKYVYNCTTIVIKNFNVHTLTLTFESITLQTFMEQYHWKFILYHLRHSFRSYTYNYTTQES